MTADIEGFVTSSCHSPVLGHPVALGMLARGQSRIGDTVTVWHLGSRIEADVVKTPFYDPSGERVNGIG